MGKYRGRLQIVADILSIIEEGSKKTRIMYRANLSYKLLCRYLDEVIVADLAKHEDQNSYVLTSKGEEFLGKYADYTKHYRNLREHIHDVNVKKASLEKMCLQPTKNSRNNSGRAPRRRTGKKKETKKMPKLTGSVRVTALLILLLVTSMPLIVTSSALPGMNQTAQGIADAEEAVADAYQAILQAEQAGADVTALLLKLNEAGDYLSKGRLIGSTNDIDAAIRLAEEVRGEAIDLKETATSLNLQHTMLKMIVSIVSLVLIAIGSMLSWSYFKHRYGESSTAVRLDIQSGAQ